MKVVICPVGGVGERFLKYSQVPKPLIKVQGKSQLAWAIAGADRSYDPDLFVISCRSGIFAEIREHINEAPNDFPKTKIEVLDIGTSTRGAAHTIALSLENIDVEGIYSSFVSIDSDSFVITTAGWPETNFVSVFRSANSAHSYVEFNSRNMLTKIKEKEKISPWAVGGHYGFANTREYLEGFSKLAEAWAADELYLSTMVTELSKHRDFEVIFSEKTVPLGTPAEIDFLKSSNFEIQSYLT